MELLAQAASPDWPALSGWAAFALAALAWVSREILPFLRERRKADMDEKHAEDARLIKPYQEQIAELKGQVTRLDGLLTDTTRRHEEELAQLRAEHLECVKNHAALEATVKLMQGEVQNLRDWRHDLANQQGAAALAARVKEETEPG